MNKPKLFASILLCILIFAISVFASHQAQTYGSIAYQYNAPPPRFPQSPNADYDNDGVTNERDICSNTFQGETVTTDGCTARQLLAQAANELPQEYDYRISNINRIPVRLTHQALQKSLSSFYYKPSRDELNCDGAEVLRASLDAVYELMPLSCIVTRETSSSAATTVQLVEGKGTYISRSGRSFTIFGSGNKAIQVIDLGVVCDTRLRPLASGALIRVLNANELLAKTAAERSSCGRDARQRAFQNIEYGEQNRRKGYAMSAMRNYQLAWKHATGCNCQ